MRKDHSILMTAAMAALMLGTTGCGKDKPAEANPGADASAAQAVMAPEVAIDDSVLYDLYYSIDDLIQAGDTNKANATFVEALGKKDYEQVRGPLFNSMIRYFLFTQQFDKAKEQYLIALRTMPEIATPGFDTIYGAYVEKQDVEGALDWARVLATQDIGEDLRLTATDWLMGSLFRNGKIDEMAQEAAKAADKFPADKVSAKLDNLAQEALAAENVTAAEKLLAVMTTCSKKGDAAMKESASTLGVRIDAAKGLWKDIAKRVPQLMTEVSDQPLQQAMLYAFQTARKAGRYEMVDAMASPVVLDERAAKVDKTRYVCAREWVDVVFEGTNKDIPSFPARFDKLIQVKLEPFQLYSIYSRHFYDIINDPAVLKECVVLVDKLIPTLKEQSMQDSLVSYQLDASFLIEDYDRALKILEKGVAERDAAWHKMAITKVKAHKALKDKQYDDAIKYFREFMGTLSEEDTTDPVTDVVYSKLTLLGNNEKRIGDIYIDAGRSADAAKAYGAARDWYKKALAANKAGAETEKYIKEQIAALPSKGAAKKAPAPAK